MNIENLNKETHIPPTPLEKLSQGVGQMDATELNQSLDSFRRNTREYGINECKDAAKRIFTPDALNHWGELSPNERERLAKEYGNEVARSFNLREFRAVVFETMEGKNGYNRGDGIAHLSDHLTKQQNSPLQIVDTLTHELRHQYQMEAIKGLHNVPDETRLEWIRGAENYTSQMPWAEDPWGYKYNPLETDARYAGESVVRELTKDYINGNFA